MDSEQKRDEALDKVKRGANKDWMEQAQRAITDAAFANPDGSTTDDVWALVEAPREPRAMGAAILMAARQGRIRSSGEYRRSRRTACNARPVAVWRRGA